MHNFARGKIFLCLDPKSHSTCSLLNTASLSLSLSIFIHSDTWAFISAYFWKYLILTYSHTHLFSLSEPTFTHTSFIRGRLLVISLPCCKVLICYSKITKVNALLPKHIYDLCRKEFQQYMCKQLETSLLQRRQLKTAINQ